MGVSVLTSYPDLPITHKHLHAVISYHTTLYDSVQFFVHMHSRISEYVPPRPPIPRQVGGTERAVLEFHSQTANVANMLLEQFRELYGKELSKGDLDNSQKAIDERYRSHIKSDGVETVTKSTVYTLAVLNR